MRCCFDKVRVELEPKEDHISQQISLAIGRHRIPYKKQVVNVAIFPSVTESFLSDIVYRYDGKVDALTIYFAQATPGLISHSESDDDEICIYDFTQSDELVSIEILDASRVLLCHFYNESNKIDNLSTFLLPAKHNSSQNSTAIFLVESVDEPMIETKKSSPHPDVFSCFLEGKLVGFQIKETSTTLCKTAACPFNSKHQHHE